MTGKRLLILVLLSFIVQIGKSQNFFSDERIIYSSEMVVPASVYYLCSITTGEGVVMLKIIKE